MENVQNNLCNIYYLFIFFPPFRDDFRCRASLNFFECCFHFNFWLLMIKLKWCVVYGKIYYDNLQSNFLIKIVCTNMHFSMSSKVWKLFYLLTASNQHRNDSATKWISNVIRDKNPTRKCDWCSPTGHAKNHTCMYVCIYLRNMINQEESEASKKLLNKREIYNVIV